MRARLRLRGAGRDRARKTTPGSTPTTPSGKKAIEAKDWRAAIRSADFGRAARHAQRRTSRITSATPTATAAISPVAFRHYNRALQLNPRHRGAHEYLGEAYLMVGNLAKAEEHLALLSKICLIPCEEYAMLERKIASYGAGGK